MKLRDFYTLMDQSATIRRDMADYSLGGMVQPQKTQMLESALEQLKRLPESAKGTVEMEADDGSPVEAELGYEISELEKDLAFFSGDDDALLERLRSANPGFVGEHEGARSFLGDFAPNAFVTDRDGTVNNYCGRYRSSIQSAYNAVYLTRFAQSLSGPAVILTSAPLENTGIIDISVLPENEYVLAGSKGREFRRTDGSRARFPLDSAALARLKELNTELRALLAKAENRVFSLIGSGFQEKYGEMTVARQDVYGSIAPSESERFLREVRRTVSSIDPDGSSFSIEDTGKDIEIVVATGGEADIRNFNKGDGLRFIDGELPLRLGEHKTLICGDTWSDLSMLEHARSSGAEFATVFVTNDRELRGRVRELADRYFFVSGPDALVAALGTL